MSRATASDALGAREYNRRVKRAIAELKAAGAKRVAVDILPDGRTRVLEDVDEARESEADRLGDMIESMGRGG
jgi:hypothetical protein